MKILVATEKPFAKAAVDGIASLVKEAGHTLALLEKQTSVEQFYEAVSDADALIVRSDKVTKEVINAAKNLKIVVRAGAGYDNLDLAACTQRGIIAMNTPGQNSNAVAELAIGMMVFMARNAFNPGTGSELKGKRIGLQAYGNVGCLVAKIAIGFGMEVYAFDPYSQKIETDKDFVTSVPTVEELYEKSDFISIHIPAIPQTIGSIGHNLLERLPKGACIVNTARKEVINEKELIEVLDKRPDLKYITDVATENHALIAEKFGKRVFATTKKMGAETSEANINAGLAAAEQIIKFLKSGDITFQVNK